VLYHYNSSGTNFSTTFTKPYWATNTGGVGQGFAIMQTDGNFVLYKGTGPSNNLGYIWSISHTSLPTGPYFAIMQDDGNFVVYKGSGPSDNHGAIWDSKTVAGVGLKLTIASGNNQTQPLLRGPGGWLPVNFGPLSVTLTDNIGNPLSSKQITWSVSSHPANMEVQLASTTTTTDSNGIATLNSVQANYVNGAFTVVASYGSASVTFNLTVGGLSTSIVAGNNQSIACSSTVAGLPGILYALFAPLQVKVVIVATGQPISGANVIALPGNVPQGMAVDFQYGSSVTTDSNGIATFNMMASRASGPFTVIVNTDGGSNQVTFNETVSS
jgi:hypothetical protein